jgi:hypothetical protein
LHNPLGGCHVHSRGWALPYLGWGARGPSSNPAQSDPSRALTSNGVNLSGYDRFLKWTASLQGYVADSGGTFDGMDISDRPLLTYGLIVLLFGSGQSPATRRSRMLP